MKEKLNKFYHAYKFQIDDWVSFPNKKSPIVELKIGNWVYQIDLKYLALYAEIANMDARPFPIPYPTGDKTKKGRHLVNEWQFENNDTSTVEKFDAIIQQIKPHLRRVDIVITWGTKRVSEHEF
jgi:hypothetical protein